jgi:hypothetical protein
MQRGDPRRILWGIFCGVALLALLIIPMELQISWNKLDGLEGITSTGQLISLTVGSFSLIRAVFLTGMGDSEEGDSGERDLESQGSQRPATVVPEITTEVNQGADSRSHAQTSTLAPPPEIAVRPWKRNTL